MKKRSMLFAAALALLVTTAASAQTIRLKVNVPFSFIANRATLPAGEYSVKSVNDLGTAVAIYDANSKTTNVVLTHARGTTGAAQESKLVFHRYGGQYFLTQIWAEGNNAGRELSTSSGEREVAKASSTQEVVEVAARR